MPKFRKIPVIIEAFRPFLDETPAWFQAAMDAGAVRYMPGFEFIGIEGIKRAEHFLIVNGPDVLKVFKGDWVIKGTAGELYLCKPEIFAGIYEAAE